MADSQNKIFLRIRTEDSAPIDVVVESFPCVIGRADDNDVVIKHPSISSHHAEMALEEGGVLLKDLGSTNGLFMEDRKWPEILIDKACRIAFGRVIIDFAFSMADLDEMPVSLPISRKIEDTAAAVAPSEQDVEKLWASEEKAPEAAVPAFTPIPVESKKEIICPHCWHRFDVDEFLFIARHQSLIGDSVLGSDAAQRFLPSRFTPEGNAIDAGGMSCPDMACPRCHLRIPQSASEMPPLFLSIVGATASGKSYFLTSLCWELRNTLPRDFAISFSDTDAVNNQILNDFEETIFLSSRPDELAALRKTELQGELYNQVLLDNMLINLPRPFMFTVTPSEHHPRYNEVKESMSRTLVLYDNAGEHFEPGMDSADNPTTQHLLHSDTIFFIYDPTKDVRFRKRLIGVDDPQLSMNARVQRQEIILTEMINRIKKYTGMHSGHKGRKSMIVLVSKFDAWKGLLDMELPAEPWQWVPEYNTSALDVPYLKQVSFAIRQILDEICPEVVSTAESFAGEVLYLPNSALGHSPELDEESGMIGIRPRDVAPFWVAVPMLYFFYERGFIQSIPDNMVTVHEDTPCQCTESGDIFFVCLPGRNKPLQIPRSFAGCQLRCPGTDIWFTLPGKK